MSHIWSNFISNQSWDQIKHNGCFLTLIRPRVGQASLFGDRRGIYASSVKNKTKGGVGHSPCNHFLLIPGGSSLVCQDFWIVWILFFELIWFFFRIVLSLRIISKQATQPQFCSKKYKNYSLFILCNKHIFPYEFEFYMTNLFFWGI